MYYKIVFFDPDSTDLLQTMNSNTRMNSDRVSSSGSSASGGSGDDKRTLYDPASFVMSHQGFFGGKFIG